MLDGHVKPLISPEWNGKVLHDFCNKYTYDLSCFHIFQKGSDDLL